MRLTSQLRTVVRSAIRPITRPFTRVLADAGTAIADGEARFWGLAEVRPLPLSVPRSDATSARPQEATP
ncbi:MAG TPA: hypothetical protein VFW06_00505 [Acidimicrobiia bacterium]|nr:hypothetical protein [Acidimicrobiia bacterium]